MVQPRQAQIHVDHHVPANLVLVPHADQDQLLATHRDDWTWSMVKPALHDNCCSMLVESAHLARRGEQ